MVVSNHPTLLLFGTMSAIPALITTNLIARWKFDEGSGQVLGDSIGSNDGELGSTPGVDTNDPSWGGYPDPGSGPNVGLYFNGQESVDHDYVLIPYFLDPARDFTITLVGQHADVNASANNWLSQQDGTGTGRTWIGVTTANQVFCFIGGVSVLNTTSLTVGTFYAITIRNSSGTISVIINNGSPESSAVTPELANGSHVIGASKTLAGGPLEGEMLIYGIAYDSALSDAEIQDTNFPALQYQASLKGITL